MLRIPQRRAVVPVAVLLAVLVGACRQRAEAPDRIGGLYFADAGFAGTHATPKLLLLRDGHFELLQGTELSSHGTYEAQEGLLRLKPAGLGPGAELETTYAVVEGRLLLGVLRRVGRERKRWTSAALPPEFLGDQEMALARQAAFRIDWDMEEGEWRFTSGTRQVVLKGVASVELPEQRGRSFVPIFRRPAQRGGGDDPAAMLSQEPRILAPELSGIGRFGLEAGPSRKGGGPAGPRDGMASVLSNRTLSHAYEHRGDVVVTPWTVDLGPVGLLPVLSEPSKLAGRYVKGDEVLTVLTTPPASNFQQEGYDPGFRRPGDEQKCFYLPDARGLAARVLGMEHFPASHFDKPISVFCFALADGRVVRYVSSGGCSGMEPAKLDVFQRGPPAGP